MSINFPLILVLGSFITGIIWLIDSLFFAKSRKEDFAYQTESGREHDGEAREYKEPFLIEISKFLFPVFVVVLVLRSFIVEPFRIPTGSMIPTLEIGDFILVNKFSYGLRLPITNTKFVSFGDPERGDVVVFRYPENEKVDYIKRVIGLPGDEIAYHNKTVFINGKPVEQKELKRIPLARDELIRLEEMLGEIKHKVHHYRNAYSGSRSYKVPAGHYFVMGDNRDKSYDSREWGFVPEKNLVGKAFIIWMNMSFEPFEWPKWSRIGTIIK